MKKKIRINVAFETEMEERENVMKEMFVFLKAFSIHASGVRLLVNYCNSYSLLATHAQFLKKTTTETAEMLAWNNIIMGLSMLYLSL